MHASTILMLAKRRRWMIAGGILLATLLCLAGGIGTIRWYQRATSCHDNQAPLKSFDVTLDVSGQEALIEQFRKFANKDGFSFHINFYTPDNIQFLIDLKRRDTEVIATNPLGPGEFKVGFYNNDGNYPISV
jgi:hypothetical protein